MQQPNRYDAGLVVAWKWVAPRALDPTVAPSVSFKRDGIEILAADLTPVHEPITLTAYGTDEMRVKFIASENLENTDFLADETMRKAFIVSVGDGVFPVEVVSAKAGQTSLFIGSPLPRTVSFPVTLQWATYATEIGPEDVTESLSRNILWTVEYSPLALGGELAGFTPTDLERGRVIVSRAFKTGLDHSQFLDYFPSFAQKISSKENSLAKQIEITERMLINKITCVARSRDKTENELFGEDFIDAHAYLTAYFIAKHNESDAAKGYYEMFEKLLNTSLETAWLDSNIDNQVGRNEEGVISHYIEVPARERTLHSESANKITCRDPYYDRHGCGLYWDAGYRSC